MRLQFKGKSPVWAKILIGLMLAHGALQLATGYWIPNRAPIDPDALHSYRIQSRGGPPYFVQPWMGEYYDSGLYIGLGLVAVFLLFLWIDRDKIERIR